MEDIDADVFETEHGHCASCYLMTCTYHACRVVECKNKCGTRYHQCKEQDHLEEICSEQVHDCFNQSIDSEYASSQTCEA